MFDEVRDECFAICYCSRSTNSRIKSVLSSNVQDQLVEVEVPQGHVTRSARQWRDRD